MFRISFRVPTKHQRIEKVKTASEGTLYGLIDNTNDTVYLLGFSLGAVSIEDNLPLGVAATGRIKWNRIARPSAFDWTKVLTMEHTHNPSMSRYSIIVCFFF